MNKRAIKYTQRQPVRIPTAPHDHNFSVITKTTGTQVRFGCDSCPSMCEWTPIRYLEEGERNRVELTHKATRKNPRLSTIQRAARANGGRVHLQLVDEKSNTPIYDSTRDAVDILTGKSGWTVDNEGRTPDEQPNLGGFYGDETVPRAPKPHVPPVLDGCKDCLKDVDGCTCDLEDDEPLKLDMSYPPNSHVKFYEQNPDAGTGIPEDAARQALREKLRQMTKTELVAEYKYRTVYPSWTKDRIIERIVETEKF